MNNYETKVLEKLYEYSDSDVHLSLRRGDVFIKEISQSTGLTISLVKKTIVSLRRLRILDVAPTHDIHDLTNKMPFVIFIVHAVFQKFFKGKPTEVRMCLTR